MSSPISIFIKELFNESIEYYYEIEDKEIVLDFSYKFNGEIIYGSIDIGIDKHGFYQVYESDISIPFPKVNIPKIFRDILIETDIHDYNPDYHHHFITKVPVTLNQLKAILKYFYKLYLFGEWKYEE